MGSSDMKRRETLERRLEEKGLERQAIPRFIRSLNQTLSFNPHASPQQIHQLMRSMGWNIPDLDVHTLQMAISRLQDVGSISLIPGFDTA